MGLIFTAIAFAMYLVVYIADDAISFGNCFFMVIFMGFSLVSVWVGQRTQIINYNSRQVREFKSQEQANLVNQLLPAHVF